MNEKLLVRLRRETKSLRLRNEEILEEIEMKKNKVLEMEIRSRELTDDLAKTESLLENFTNGSE